MLLSPSRRCLPAQVGVIRFESSAAVDIPLSADVTGTLAAIAALDTSSTGTTDITEALGLYQSHSAAFGRADASKLCVLLSDGAPNDFTSANAQVSGQLRPLPSRVPAHAVVGQSACSLARLWRWAAPTGACHQDRRRLPRRTVRERLAEHRHSRT